MKYDMGGVTENSLSMGPNVLAMPLVFISPFTRMISRLKYKCPPGIQYREIWDFWVPCRVLVPRYTRFNSLCTVNCNNLYSLQCWYIFLNNRVTQIWKPVTNSRLLSHTTVPNISIVGQNTVKCTARVTDRTYILFLNSVDLFIIFGVSIREQLGLHVKLMPKRNYDHIQQSYDFFFFFFCIF